MKLARTLSSVQLDVREVPDKYYNRSATASTQYQQIHVRDEKHPRVLLGIRVAK